MYSSLRLEFDVRTGRSLSFVEGGTQCKFASRHVGGHLHWDQEKRELSAVELKHWSNQSGFLVLVPYRTDASIFFLYLHCTKTNEINCICLGLSEREEALQNRLV
jgi:hypothetical protein